MEGRWVSHASEGLVTAALLSSTEELRAAGMEHEGELDAHHPAALGLACSPNDGAYAYASLEKNGAASSWSDGCTAENELAMGIPSTTNPCC